MNTEPKKEPSARLRNVLDNQSALDHLPKRRNDTSVKMDEANRASHPPKPDSVSSSSGLHLRILPAFWTIASILSLTINLVLIVALIALWSNIPSLKVDGTVNGLLGMGDNLLGGLYKNFEKMDRAHITRTIPVDTTIPVKFDLQLNQSTNVVLSQDVTINNALVTVNTGGLNITRALTTIVLPQGTNLPIVLNLTVPVDTTIPVKLNVEVDIPLQETQLHDPFKGLGEVVQPFYCMVNPAAVNMDGQPVCPNK